ncbi:MAG: CDK5RAP3 family protein [Bacteroidota bacterium]|nr:CDK5RAP3 family protein [Bacteroidota bacterium]
MKPADAFKLAHLLEKIYSREEAEELVNCIDRIKSSSNPPESSFQAYTGISTIPKQHTPHTDLNALKEIFLTKDEMIAMLQQVEQKRQMEKYQQQSEESDRKDRNFKRLVVAFFALVYI